MGDRAEFLEGTPANNPRRQSRAGGGETGTRPGRARVTVAIINHNGRRFLDELLGSLRNQSFDDFQTLLIDNASQDGSVEYVRNNFHWVQVLPQAVNRGFSYAGNVAAEASRSTYLVLLNTDMALDRHWLRSLVEAAESDRSVAAVASKLRLYALPDRLNGVGGVMNYLGYTWDRGMLEEDRAQYDRSAEVLFASAAAALFRRATFLEAGGFDDQFFMYHEDVDLCWRLWILGYRVITAPEAVAYHHFSGTTADTRGMAWRERIGERHSIRSLLKNYQFGNLLRALKDLIILRQSLPRKSAQAANFLWNLWKLPDTLKRRRWIQKRRRRSDREIEHLIVQSKDVPIRL